MMRFLLLAPLSAAQDPEIYAPTSQTTKLGCKCISTCMTSYDVNCHSDLWCEVDGEQCDLGTAHFSASRKIIFDYCVYPAYWPYERKTALEKQALLMKKVLADATPQTWPSPITDIWDVSMFISANAVADVFPQPRKKYMHAIGTVAPVKFVSAKNHPYTGLFNGADYGLLRAGMTLPASPLDGIWFDKVIPGVALKLFRDGLPSSNIVLIPDVKPQECGSNFFADNFSTHIRQTDPLQSPFLDFAGKKLPQATACATQVGTSNLAARNGQVASDDIFPFKVEFYTAQHNLPIACDDFVGSLSNFSSIPPGARLYDVYATQNPGDERQLIGHVDLTGSFTMSDFGDRSLFFMHQPVEDDFKFRPDWLASPDAGCSYTPWLVQPPVDIGCAVCTGSGCGANNTMLNTDSIFA